MYQRPIIATLVERLLQPRRLIQVLAGPRQTGKTTLVRQVMGGLPGPWHYASADEPALKDTAWIEQQWEVARRRLTEAGAAPTVLVLDEIHKLPGWSEAVKRLWDEDTIRGVPLHVVLLGSSPLLVRTGLADSLAGRFEVIPIAHWSFAEMRDGFGWHWQQFVYYGGYPGAAPLVEDPARWRRYVLDSLVETTISRDVLLMQRVDRPALLRRLFEIACAYSGRVLSFTKMLGQLQEKGNVTTLAHYLDLLGGSGLVAGLDKYAGQRVRQRASSPKLQVYNNALVTAQGHATFEETSQQPDLWGRLVESAVGAHLVNAASTAEVTVHYWAHRSHEVDFVLARGSRIVAIEVKSGRRRTSLPGIEAMARQFPLHRKLLVGGDGIPVAEFLATDVAEWL